MMIFKGLSEIPGTAVSEHSRRLLHIREFLSLCHLQLLFLGENKNLVRQNTKVFLSHPSLGRTNLILK